MNEKMAEVQQEMANDHLPQAIVKTPKGSATFMNMSVLSIGIKLAAEDPDMTLVPGMDTERVVDDLDLPPQSLRDGWGRRMSLQVSEEGFSIASSGPDGVAGNDDDLVIFRKLK
jgi:hypothetical protein